MSEVTEEIAAERIARRERVLRRLAPVVVFPPELLWLMADGICAGSRQRTSVTEQSEDDQIALCAQAEMALKAMVAWTDANDYPLSQAIEKHRKLCTPAPKPNGGAN